MGANGSKEHLAIYPEDYMKTSYPLSSAESKSSGDNQTKSHSFEARTDCQEEERSPSPLPCAKRESSGDDQIESDSLKALADGQEEKRWEIPLVVRPDDLTGKHRERK